MKIGSQRALKAVAKEAQGKNLEFLQWFQASNSFLSLPHCTSKHQSCFTGCDSSAGMPSRIMQRGLPVPLSTGPLRSAAPTQEMFPHRHSGPSPGAADELPHAALVPVLPSSLAERWAKGAGGPRGHSSDSSAGCYAAAALTGSSTRLSPSLLLCWGIAAGT